MGPEDQDNVGQRAAEGQDPQMPDRAEEKRVDVPQNENPVNDGQDESPTAETAPEATPTDAGTPTGDSSPGGTTGATTTP